MAYSVEKHRAAVSAGRIKKVRCAIQRETQWGEPTYSLTRTENMFTDQPEFGEYIYSNTVGSWWAENDEGEHIEGVELLPDYLQRRAWRRHLDHETIYGIWSFDEDYLGVPEAVNEFWTFSRKAGPWPEVNIRFGGWDVWRDHEDCEGDWVCRPGAGWAWRGLNGPLQNFSNQLRSWDNRHIWKEKALLWEGTRARWNADTESLKYLCLANGRMREDIQLPNEMMMEIGGFVRGTVR